MKLLYTLLLSLMLIGCGASAKDTAALVLRDATVSANATATMLETTQSLALIMYRTEQEIQIQQALSAGESKQQAVERVAKVRKQWLPVWDAFTKARVSYSLLVSLLSDKTVAPEAIQRAVDDQAKKMTVVSNELSIARSRVQGGVQ